MEVYNDIESLPVVMVKSGREFLMKIDLVVLKTSNRGTPLLLWTPRDALKKYSTYGMMLFDDAVIVSSHNN